MTELLYCVVFVPFLSLQAETSERVNERKWNTTHHSLFPLVYNEWKNERKRETSGKKESLVLFSFNLNETRASITVSI